MGRLEGFSALDFGFRVGRIVRCPWRVSQHQRRLQLGKEGTGMGETLRRPMVLIGLAIIVLAALFAYWFWSGPAAAGAAAVPNTPYHRQLDDIMRQLDNPR